MSFEWADQDLPPPDEGEEEEELDEEIEEEEDSVLSSEEEWTEEMLRSRVPFWRGPSKLPQDIPSDEEPFPQPEVLSSSDDDEIPKPRKPPKKFFENPKFYSRKNKPELSPEMWDEEENLDNIETLMKQTAEKNELDVAVLEGVLTNITPNFGFDDVIYRDSGPKPPSSIDSNFDLVLSSSDEENIPKIEVDHYKELILADDQILDCSADRKICRKMGPTKYYGLAKILERKEKVRNQKALAGTKSTLSSYMTVMNSSGEGASYCLPGSARKKGWKLKEPFPKRDSIDKNISSSSNMDIASESDRKLQDESRPGPSKIYPKCKWYDECLFKLLFKLAVKREKKNSTIKANLDVDVDEVLDDLFIMSKDAKNHLIPKITDDFQKYKSEFVRKFDQDRKQKKDTDDEEIKIWPDPLPQGQHDMEIDEMFLESVQKPESRSVQDVSARLYTKKPYKDTPRAAIEVRLAAERALDVKKKKNIIQKKFKTIEINLEALPQAMQAYYKEKEDLKRKKDREAGKPKDDDGTKRKPVEDKEKRERELRARSRSAHPSYSKLIPPYSNVCRERIRKTLKQYRKAFSDELQSLADQEIFALAGVALKRMFVITMGKGESPVKFTYHEQARLHQILEK